MIDMTPARARARRWRPGRAGRPRHERALPSADQPLLTVHEGRAGGCVCRAGWIACARLHARATRPAGPASRGARRAAGARRPGRTRVALARVVLGQQPQRRIRVQRPRRRQLRPRHRLHKCDRRPAALRRRGRADHRARRAHQRVGLRVVQLQARAACAGCKVGSLCHVPTPCP